MTAQTSSFSDPVGNVAEARRVTEELANRHISHSIKSGQLECARELCRLKSVDPHAVLIALAGHHPKKESEPVYTEIMQIAMAHMCSRVRTGSDAKAKYDDAVRKAEAAARPTGWRSLGKKTNDAYFRALDKCRSCTNG